MEEGSTMNSDAYTQPTVSDASGPASDEIVISLVHMVARIVRGRATIAIWTVTGLILSIGIALLLPKTYQAEAVFRPPTAPETLQASALFQRQDPSDLYLGMLASRSVADSVIDQVHLKDVYHVSYYADARARLESQSRFSVSKNALISIAVVTSDPRLSANIANAYLDALYQLSGSMSASASAHRSEFFRAQLNAEQEQLAQAEADMQAVQEKTGLILPESEAQAGLSSTARLQAALQDAETRLSTLLLSSTEGNPEVVQLRTQIAAIQQQIRTQQSSANNSPGAGIPSGARLPGLMLDYARKQRDLKQQEAIYESLQQQYEKARLASMDPGPELEIVDRALVPERKAGPPRTLIVLVSTFVAALLGLLWVLFSNSLRRAKERYSAVTAQVGTR
jgi:uncharacterized protein involved in exopolysaccharide biosynthesis